MFCPRCRRVLTGAYMLCVCMTGAHDLPHTDARLLRRQPLFNVCLFPNRRRFPRLYRGIFAPSKCRPFDRIAPVVEKALRRRDFRPAAWQ
jgi:hypothetical protein